MAGYTAGETTDAETGMESSDPLIQGQVNTLISSPVRTKIRIYSEGAFARAITHTVTPGVCATL